MTSLAGQKGTVMYLSLNSYMALRYEGSAVIVPPELIKREYLPDDIVEFDAVAISNKEQLMYISSGWKPKWKASKVKFIKHALVIEGVGKVLNIDAKGEFCFIEHTSQGTKYNIFCTRINVLPQVANINSIFSSGSSVRFVAKEQAPTMKSNVKWRTAAVTDMKHELRIKMTGKIKYWSAVPMNQPKPAVVATVSKASPARVNSQETPRAANASPPVKKTWSLPPTADVITKPDVKEDNEGLIEQISECDITKAESIAAPVDFSINTCSSFTDNGLIPMSPNNKPPHPLASYDWMKVDLITVLRTFQGSSNNNEGEEKECINNMPNISNSLYGYCLSH